MLQPFVQTVAYATTTVDLQEQGVNFQEISELNGDTVLEHHTRLSSDLINQNLLVLNNMIFDANGYQFINNHEIHIEGIVIFIDIEEANLQNIQVYEDSSYFLLTREEFSLQAEDLLGTIVEKKKSTAP